MKRILTSDFIKAARSCSDIICFGIGKMFTEAVAFLESLGLADKISHCVDNSPQKHGTSINVVGRDFHVISVNELAAEDTGSSIIFITCANLSEIISQLENMVCFSNVKYACYKVISGVLKERDALNKKIPSNIRLSPKPIIPKKIHYCWFGGNPIPDKYKKWMESWHKFCPDYEIIEWNESNYDISKNNYMKQAYDCKKWGFVPDYARLDIVYNHGGIYLDTGVELISSLDDLLYQEGFAGFEAEKYVALGLGFGARKELPILKEMMDVYNTAAFINDDGSLNLTASPVYSTNLLLSKGLKLNGEYQIIDGLTVFPEKTFSGKSYSTFRIKTLPYTRSIHHYDGSWLDISDKQKTDFFKQYISEELEE